MSMTSPSGTAGTTTRAGGAGTAGALRRVALPLLAGALALAACAAPVETAAPGAETSPAAAPAASTEVTCNPVATASYPPLPTTPAPGKMPSGTLMRTIADRGYLVVGVSGDTRLLGARNMLNDGKLEGFDIDLAREVAAAIFGDGSDAHIRFRVITAGQRIPLVNAGAGTRSAPGAGVDLVARAMTMTCDRWNGTERVAFSSVYLMAHQRLLVRSDSALTSLQALAGARSRVCAPTGSTSLARIAQVDGITPVGAPIHSDCLALWQEGKVDAITGDDAILAGFAAQDPGARVVGTPLEDEPYGLAVAADHPEFARFLNNVLERVRADGTWDTLYSRWLRPSLGAPATPAPDYGRTP
ncbi:MAG: glutamate ABC transporter substrate-binding protein [Kineosporiaceae bacterium]